MPGRKVLAAVQTHLVNSLGPDSGRGKVTFVGVPPLEVLRFGPRPDGTVTYATLGMSADAMTDPTSPAPDPVAGPRAELLLTVRGGHDALLRSLATLAAMPAVEGVIVGPGATYDLGAPLVPGSLCTGVLIDDPRPDVPDLVLGTLPGSHPVQFLPLVPVTASELAFKRVHGPDALWAQWHREGTDLTDLGRSTVRLTAPEAS
jgi:hypothetical protein